MGSPGEEVLDCLVCAEPCSAVAVFSCGHVVCYTCGLRIHAISKGGCPVCRVKSDHVIVTQCIPSDQTGGMDDAFTAEEVKQLKAGAVSDRKLNCYIDGKALAREISKLYEYLCPVPGCWSSGEQEPFMTMDFLKKHLLIDHGLQYCNVCLESRPAFLCEQTTYTKEEINPHMAGSCHKDVASFNGHPQCRFCQQKRFYDGEALLKHMQHEHFTCDVCNRGEFIFTFYQNRGKLLKHFELAHKLCDHVDCSSLDPMMRVFASELDLMVHKQQVHGVRTRSVALTPDALTSAPAPVGVGDLRGGRSVVVGRGGTTAPETGANTNALQITFDHVGRLEVVDIMAAKSRVGQRGNSYKGGASNTQKQRDDCGLPAHYQVDGVLRTLTRRIKEAPMPISSPAKPGKQAFGIAESEEVYNMTNKVPRDPKEQQRLLDELLEKYLTQPTAFAQFRGYTADFIRGSIMSTEYHRELRTTFFPNPAVFNEVFPLLVATIPVAQRKEALMQIQKMNSAPEAQRRERVKEEESLAQQREMEMRSIQRNIDNGRKLTFSKQKQQKEKKNAWFENNSKEPNSPDRASALSGSRPYSSVVYSGSSPTAGNVGGGRGASSGAPALVTTRDLAGAQVSPTTTGSPTFGDPSLYPALPSTAPRRGGGGGGGKKQGPRSTNAWFSR